MGMIDHLNHTWIWISDTSRYIAPALNSLIVVALGLIISLEGWREKIEKTKRRLHLCTGIFVLLACIGFFFDVTERRSSDQQIRSMLKNMTDQVGTTSELLAKVDSEAKGTNLLLQSANMELINRIGEYPLF
jgi:hypothetical protein